VKHFKRPAIAHQMADLLRGNIPFGDGKNGLFLAANRRTGKSAFLQNDLRPVLEALDIHVIYVDLWVESRTDPAMLINAAIQKKIQENLGKIAKLTKNAGIDSIGFPGMVKLDFSKIGQIGGVPIADALKTLITVTNKPVALIIDEAQHTLTTTAGIETMKALKAARDTININDRIDLMLVMTGSDRDKLVRLVKSTSAAFFGSSIQNMPTLGSDFIESVASDIEKAHPSRKVDRKNLAEVFVRLGERPQLLDKTISESLGAYSPPTDDINIDLLERANRFQVEQNEQFESSYLGLEKIDQITIWRVMESGSNLKPYDAKSLAFYSEHMGEKITANMIQNSIERLRTGDNPILWKSMSGDYSVAETAMQNWYLDLVTKNEWPPHTQLS
jgi:hypothetical protein